MGTLLSVTCNACGTTSEQLDGPVMMGFNPRCVRCGTTTFVSVEDLCAADPPELDPTSVDAWRLREARLPDVAGTCECGGTFDNEAPLRCLACRSTDITSVMTGLAD
jgi:hypothetical protein